MSWSTHDIPDLSDKRAVITGVTGGLGLHTAIGLARKGAEVVVTARDEGRAETAVSRILEQVPEARVEVVSLDLADLADVRRAAAEVSKTYDRIDMLVNNAGIMVPPKYAATADGFEMQMGTNHIGHFAWTAELWPVLKASDARVVTVSSLAHSAVGSVDLTALEPGAERPYRRWQSYGQSKLANLLFALELDRRVKAAGLRVVSVAAHPGYSATNITKTGPTGSGLSLYGIGMHQVSKILAQSASAGAQPLLMAATDTSLTGGEYVGPSGIRGLRGRPKLVGMTRAARDEELAGDLWTATERAIGATFEV
jgi:NAD(P)-dependent dehydrogenase (short-subunit alcohol dehydrogenase family)